MRKIFLCTLIPLLAICLLVSPVDAKKKKKKKDDSAPATVFYPDLPGTPRFQFLTTFNGAKDIKKKSGRFMKFVAGEEDSLEGIEKPYGAILYNGKLFVCDIGQGLVWIFDFEAQELIRMGGSPPGRLSKPAGIAIDEDGTRYVADSALRRVLVYDRENRYERAVGDPETLKPSDVVIIGDELFVCSVDEGVVVVFDKIDGTELRRIGSKGSEEGQLFFPTNLAVDRDDNIYISDTGNARVLQFNTEGELQKQFGALGLTHGNFTRPKGIAVDQKDRLYVVDAAFENIQLFDSDGTLLLFFGGPGGGVGNINLPADVSIDYEHLDLFKDKVAEGYEIEYLVIVTSHFGQNKVNIYGFITQNGE